MRARLRLQPSTGLVLDFGAGTGQDAIRSLVRSLLGLEPAGGSVRAAVHAAGEWAIADGLGRRSDVVYLNDSLDQLQPVELRAVYDATDSSTPRLRHPGDGRAGCPG